MKTKFLAAIIILTFFMTSRVVDPVEDYLWSYYAGGITNGLWSPDEFVGKYMHSLSFVYQYKYHLDTWEEANT